MADNKLSVASLFGGIGSDEQLRAATQARDFAMGQQLAGVAPERVGLLYAPQAVTAAGRAGRLFAGQDTRTKEEIEGAKNREIFQRISTEAERLHPNDRTKQLLYVANKLSAEGKVVEAQKARALAQESAKTQAEITEKEAQAKKFTAQAGEAEAKAAEARAKTATEAQDLGKFLGVSLKDVSVDGLKAASNVFNRGKNEGESDQQFKARILKELEQNIPQPDFVKVVDQVYKDPAERSKVLKQWVDAQAQTGGGALTKEVNKAIVESNSQSVVQYKDLARGGQAAADQIDATADIVFDSILGGGEVVQSLQAGFQAIADKVGLNVDMGSLTKTQQIERVINNAVLLQSGLIKGALSNAELEFLKGSVASLGDTPEAIRVALKLLANKKRIASKVYQSFTGTQGVKKVGEGFIDFEAIENTVRDELGLKDPAIFGARFITPEGTVDPKAVDITLQILKGPGTVAEKKRKIKDALGDFTLPAEMLLMQAIQAR